ncbi:hypothetical protein BDN71DRAFT_1453014 [Pleurotus eryngii]|uniref:Uncharacterized protein n=1 Tax=Pleurotus eryngii TaxID=5323 RepID=A0A9P5ZRD3_PLEER|nr:hypothetical protein BDN71DRAFT_1453014 [Pleurotus eryngii]
MTQCTFRILGIPVGGGPLEASHQDVPLLVPHQHCMHHTLFLVHLYLCFAFILEQIGFQGTTGTL